MGVLFLTFSTLGCATALSYFRLPQDERRLFEVYSTFMTSAQQAEYLNRPTPDTASTSREDGCTSGCDS